MSDELLEVKPKFLGFRTNPWPGAFPNVVEAQIKHIISPPVLHLFSGSSKIGDERIDITHSNATKNLDVFEFIQNDPRDWEFVLADPSYGSTTLHPVLGDFMSTSSGPIDRVLGVKSEH